MSYIQNAIKTLSPLVKEHPAIAIASATVLASSALLLGRRYFAGGVVPKQVWKSANLEGQVVLVTGSSKGGIGFETVRALYLKGATVVCAVRNVKRGVEECEELKSEVSRYNVKGKLDVMELDLNDLQNVKNFCLQFLQKYQRLDILVNNAGLAQSFGLTKQNLEVHMGVNHIGSFLIVHYLSNLMKETSITYQKPCKIINVASVAHNLVSTEEKALMDKKYIVNNDCSTLVPRGVFLYGRSKLANILFAKSLERKLSPEYKIGAYSLHPGAVYTNVWRNATFLVRTVVNALSLYIMKTPRGGAQTQIYLCLEDFSKLKNGGYYEDCKLHSETELARSEKMQDKLWEISEELCKEFM